MLFTSRYGRIVNCSFQISKLIGNDRYSRFTQSFHFPKLLHDSPAIMESRKIILPPLELQRPISIPHKLLLGPGPANTTQRVRDASSLPMLGHMHSEFMQLMAEAKAGIKYAFQTTNEYTFAVSGAGHAAMEAALCNILEPGDTICIVVNGLWGERASDIAERCGGKVHKIKVEPGEAATLEMIGQALRLHKPSVLFVCHGDSSTGVVHPLDGLGALCQSQSCLLLVDCVASLGAAPVFMDQQGIDIMYSGSQKVLNAPPGISPISFNDKAMSKIKSRKTKVQSYYFDALLLGNYWGCDDSAPRYHHTAPVNLVYALREALAMLAEETLEESWERHRRNTHLFHQGIKQIGLELLVKNPDQRLPTITTIMVPDHVDDLKVIDYCMKKYFLEISKGLAPLGGKIWRVGLMGTNSCPKNVSFVLGALKEAVNSTQNLKGSAKL